MDLVNAQQGTKEKSMDVIHHAAFGVSCVAQWNLAR